jgi:acetyl esterase/lipase
VLQLLIYPCVDIACESASMTTYADAFPLNRALMDWFTAQYLGPHDNPADPRLSPLRAEDLAGLAPAIVVTAGFDPLVDQGEAYARKLKAAHVPTVYRCYDSLSHAFAAFTGAIPAADTACREIAGLVREGYEGRIA